jgi:hypothetical protein
MATPALIDLSNYNTLLKQSTTDRLNSPDGNVYFNKTTGEIEFIPADELPLINLGSGDEANPLTKELGIKFEAIYAFENQERRTDETLRQYDRWTSGTFKFGGAYNFINAREPSTDADVAIIRGSGWNQLDTSGVIKKIYFGNKGLSNIDPTSTPYYQLTEGGEPTDFSKEGQIDEAVLVYDVAGEDHRTYEAVSVRTFGNNYDRKETTTDLGIVELGGYSTGFALTESSHLTTGDYSLSDVYGGAQIAPWTGMSLEKLATAVTKNEFAEAGGDFTWVLHNTESGSIYEVVAFLDALAQTDDDIDSGTETITNGKRVGTWYSYNPSGQIVTNSGADNLGLYIENIPVADQQLVVFTDDAGDVKSYSFTVSVEANIGATAKSDANAWYHSFFAAAYNTAGAITVLDSTANEVKGFASAADTSNVIKFSFDYTGDTIGGSANTNKNCVFLVEGDGGATQAKTLYTITESTTVSFACAPSTENNA